MDAGYFQAGLLSWAADYAEQNIGEPPFGRGLQAWLKNSPPFNVERINTPLQLFACGGGLSAVLFTGWEMFSRLRKLGKPVELFVVPDIEHGSHGIQNPRQCLAVRERALDWWNFWLQGLEDRSGYKHEQYRGWRVLRELHEKVGSATRY